MLGSIILVLLICIGIPVGAKILKERSEKAAQAKKEEEKQQKQDQIKKEKENRTKAIDEFKANVDVNAEIDYIFSVIKDNPTVQAFEQGLENWIKKVNTTLGKDEVRPILLEALVKRLVESSDELAFDKAASAILSSYFANNMKNILIDDYVIIAQADMHIKGETSSL